MNIEHQANTSSLSIMLHTRFESIILRNLWPHTITAPAIHCSQTQSESCSAEMTFTTGPS
jgi:hypothetical protein